MNAYELADELENKDRLWNVDENHSAYRRV